MGKNRTVFSRTLKLTNNNVEDTISFIDSMYEKIKYKTLKEQLLNPFMTEAVIIQKPVH